MVEMGGRRVRTREPVREQSRLVFEVPEDSLPRDHTARLLWRVVETLDLSAFLRTARAVEGHPGRDVTSVRMLLALWLYAISEGIGSAREIERRITTDTAFRWIVGDQSVKRSKLCEFRVEHQQALDALFTQVLGALLHRRLIALDLVAQDGTRVRASASAPSFRREESLHDCREQAALHVKAVLAAGDDPELRERLQRAREAKALDYQRRVEAAIAELGVIDERRFETRSKTKEPPRASTTDPQSRVMKMPDGGYRPAYNVQLAVVGSAMGGPRTVVGVHVTNIGSDMSSVTPMLQQIEQRTGKLPSAVVADGNHAAADCIRYCASREVQPIIAVPKNATGSDEATAGWLELMKTPQAKALYKQRASLCELQNAHLKGRLGLGSFLVRGLNKVTCVALLTAIASNLLAHGSALFA
jgi:transposase